MSDPALTKPASQAAALLLLTAGCADGPLQVTNIQIGRSINPDGSVASPTTLFKFNQTTYVAAQTTGGSGTIGVKWMYGTRVIDEPTKQVYPSPSTATRSRGSQGKDEE